VVRAKPNEIHPATRTFQALRIFVNEELDELHLALSAAERVLKTGAPYSFAPMSSRERRLLHLAFRDHAALATQSEGEGGRRYVVLYPKDARPARPARR